MASEGAGGLSTTAIERCIDNWETETQDGAEIPAAHAELAALVERAGRVAALEGTLLDETARRDADAGDEARCPTCGQATIPFYDGKGRVDHQPAVTPEQLADLRARAGRAAALVDLLGSADCSWEERGGGHDWPEACEEARAAWAEFDALRAGGAGDR